MSDPFTFDAAQKNAFILEYNTAAANYNADNDQEGVFTALYDLLIDMISEWTVGK